MSNLYIGLMSGTSADGIDAALVEFKDATFRIHHAIDIPYQPEFRKRILALALNDACSKAELATISVELADLFASAVHQLLNLSAISPAQITAIGSHGHTIDHAPNNPLPYTFQIADHARLTEKTGITVVCDFRTRDVAAGGQGAPLVPAFHRWLFNASGQNCHDAEKAFINIGGISNITLLKKGLGYDCGPGNCLIDYWHHRHTGENYDASGNTARLGKLAPELFNGMIEERYFSAPAPKSTGREYFNQQWLDSYLQDKSYSWHDISFTLTALTAKVIADQLNNYECCEAYICGGGSHNNLLLEQIQQYAPAVSLKTTSDLGIAPDWIEAAAFAWLARQTLLGLPGNLPTATGAAGERILGAIYPA
ncbi:anhydro-N-acetylmuramic acid kinase [Oceanospirillum sp. HFRX-1_2]